MNNKIYLNCKKLELEEKEKFEKMNALFNILNFENYFKKEKSKEAIKQIKEYLKMLQAKDVNALTLEKTNLRESCEHEIILKTNINTTCAICGRNINIDENYKGIIIELESTYSEHYIFNLIDETLKFIAINNLDLLENFEKIFIEKLNSLNSQEKANLKLRRIS